MATAALRGRKCKIRISSPLGTGGLIFNEVRNWSITPTQQMIDASSCDSSGWNEYIPGQRGFVFRAETVYAPQSNGSSGVGRDIARLVESLFGSQYLSGVTIQLNVDPLSTSTQPPNSGTWSVGSLSGGSTERVAMLTNARVGGSYDNLQLFEFEITGTRALTYSS